MGSVIVLFLLVVSQECIVLSVAYTPQENICGNDFQYIESAIHSVKDEDTVYLFANSTVYTLNMSNADQPKIAAVNDLHEWHPDIKSPIHYAYTTKSDPNYIELTNCKPEVRKDWIIRIDGHKLVATLEADHCGMTVAGDSKHLDFIVGPDADTKSFYLDASTHPIPGEVTLMTNRLGDDNWEIREQSGMIKLVNSGDDVQKDASRPWTQVNGQNIFAIFIHQAHWHFFGGQYYCRTALNIGTYEKCEPQPISDWISNCKDGKVEIQSSEQKNTDISLYVIIVVIIIALAVITLVVIALFIAREVSRKKTNSSQQTNSSTN